MMRIALFADTHGNLPALEALLVHAASKKADECWNLGDMVGYGPLPNEVVALFRRRCTRHILGNHDIKCATPDHAARMRAGGRDTDKIFSFDWTNSNLTADNIAFIKTLAVTQRVDIEGVRVLLTHGSPHAMEDTLTPRTPAVKFHTLAGEVAADGINLVLCGHTHEFFDRTFDGVRFINPGGAGRSFNGDPRAAYAILDVSSLGVKVEPYRVEFSMDSLAAAMRVNNFPQRLVRTLTEARSLEELDRIPQENTPNLIQNAEELGRSLKYEAPHARQVARLAGILFDSLEAVHGLTWRERAYLQAAALLHDIGWIHGQEGHHKVSRDLIMKDQTLPLDERERAMVALTARYHRHTLPDIGHKYTRDQTSYDRETTAVLAALLRIADGLDCSHRSLVKDVKFSVKGKRMTFMVQPLKNGKIESELKAAKVKSDLLHKIFGFDIEFK